MPNGSSSAALRRSLLAILLIVACATPPASSPGPDGARASPPPDWSAPVDFGHLRAAYGERADFFQVCENGRSERTWFELVSNARWEDVLTLSRAWLSHCPVDIDAHLVTAAALTKLSRENEAEPHTRWFRGLVGSVLASGDGRTPETAWVVISVAEEYSVLRALRLDIKKQALVEHKIDALTVESPSGTGTVYFDPAAHFRRLTRELGTVGR